MPTLVYNCPSGISGDMNLGAMVALGVDPKLLEAELRKLPYEAWHLHFDPDVRGGISGIRCTVHAHDHDDKHSCSHENGHHHRTFADIQKTVKGSELSDSVKTDAIACFHALAVAEGAVHGIAPEEVHFHEVGAIDSIVDMIGAAICWELLGVDRIVCQNLEVGGGTVQCAHGRIPIPAPATARLLTGKPYSAGATDQEATTPTGAALLVGRGAEFGAITRGRQIATAIGVGQRDDPKLPNVLYATLIDESVVCAPTSDRVYELAVNLDDMTGEAIGYLCEQIRKAGTLDVWQVAAAFKKGRPGTVVHCLCQATDLERIEATIFKHSLSIGIRRQLWERTKLQRENVTLETEFGTVRAKVSTLPDGSVYRKFEYEDCARIARKASKSIDEVIALLDATH
jgi:uncharacterized protein (TIGR00299 family) protein